MKEVRCVSCNKLLGKFNSADGQIKCTKCKTLNNITTLIESATAPYQDRLSLIKKQNA